MGAQSHIFFYPFDSELSYVANLVMGTLEPPADAIDFTAPAGGSATRELAIPFLPGMDEIRVDAAEIRLRAGSLETESSSHTSVPGPSGQGAFLGLAGPGLLKKVVLEYQEPAPQLGITFRLVVRLATRKGAGFEAGVPIFAEPPLGSLGAMYGPALPGFALMPVGGNRVQLTLPSLRGDAWLFQIATGNTPDALAPQPIVPTVRSVILDAAPKDVAVSLAAASGETTLWNNPGLLLPGGEAQVVSFTPLAQRHLTDKLKTAAANAPTLSVSLKFASAAAGRLEISGKTLASSYVAKPLGAEARKIAIPGDRAPVTFDLPSGLTPASNRFKLTLRAKPRKRDALSPPAPVGAPVTGLRVSQSEYVAAGIPYSGAAALVAVRLCLAAQGDAEAVLTLHADVAGAPGEMIAGPVVFRPNGAPAWTDLELPAPLAPGAAKLWLALRTSKGTLHWFGDANASGDPRLSRDDARSWTAVPGRLAGPAKLLGQLMIEADPIADPPRLTLLAGDTVLADDLLAGIAGTAPGEFIVAAAAFPPGSLGGPAQTGGKTPLHFDLSSAYQCEATIEDFAVIYDPATAKGAV